MLTSILATITAISEAIPAILTLYNFYLEAKKKGWVRDVKELTSEVKNAKSDTERMDLAQRLFNSRAK